MTPRRMRGEDGVSMVIALGFLIVFALLVPAVVRLGTTNLLDTSRLREQRSDVYASDAGLDGAIQFLRQPANSSCGRKFAPACTFETTVGGKTASVSMTGTGGVLDFDRTVELVATVDGRTRGRATVVIRDSSTDAEPPVDVKDWTYLR